MPLVPPMTRATFPDNVLSFGATPKPAVLVANGPHLLDAIHLVAPLFSKTARQRNARRYSGLFLELETDLDLHQCSEADGGLPRFAQPKGHGLNGRRRIFK